MRNCLGYLLGRVGVLSVPEFLRESMVASISEVQVESKEMLRVLEEFNEALGKLKNKSNYSEE